MVLGWLGNKNKDKNNDNDNDSQGEASESILGRLRDRLSKTRKSLADRLEPLFIGKKQINEELFEELEEVLITSDIGVQTATSLLERVRQNVERKSLKNPMEVRSALQTEILACLKQPATAVFDHNTTPHVIMVIGVNGVGKTTTIAKLAAQNIQRGKRVLLVAADTFRAAAVEQLELWANRVGAEFVCHKGNADPSAVAYDGIEAAKARGIDIVFIDTAGRLHTKVNLMEELKKIKRIISKQIPDAPHETLLVLDATTGQNAINQAQIFNHAIEITGIALTKLDGTAKGGIVVGICDRLQIPIYYIGLGETAEDLQLFDAEAFTKALF